MGYPRIMGAGCAGATSKMFNVNVNQIQFGDKLQGLPPVTGRRRPHKSIRAKEGGNLPDRERIYCINQLGSIGMGNKNSQFAANADGIGPCPNRKNRRGYHGLHIKHHHPTEEHPNRGVSRATEHEDFNTGNMFFGNFMTSQSDNNTGGGTNDGCWDLGGVPTQWACCPEGYEPVGNGSACQKKDDPSKLCSLNASNPTLNCCGRPEEGSNGTWPLPCTDKRCWDLGGGKWACCPEGYGPSGNGSACQKKDDPSDMCSLNESNPTLKCCGPPAEEWATWPLPHCTDPDPPSPEPQSDFALGKCYSEMSPGFGVYLEPDSKLTKATFTTFGAGDTQPGVHYGNMNTFLKDDNVINSSIAIPASWFNANLKEHMPNLTGSPGWCDQGFVWSMDDSCNPCNWAGGNTCDAANGGPAPLAGNCHPGLHGPNGAFVADVNTGEPLVFKIWYGGGNGGLVPHPPAPQPDDNKFIVCIATDACGGFCNKGINAVGVPPPEGTQGLIYGVDPDATGDGFYGWERSSSGIDCQWSATTRQMPPPGMSCDPTDNPDNSKCFNNSDKLTGTSPAGPWKLAKDFTANDTEEMFKKAWTQEGSWRCPVSQLVQRAIPTPPGPPPHFPIRTEALFDNSDFGNVDIGTAYTDGVSAVVGGPGLPPDMFSDSCSGRFAHFDIRAAIGTIGDYSLLTEKWGLDEGTDVGNGEVWYQRMSWSELKDHLSVGTIGPAQLENLKNRSTYKILT